MRRKRRKLTFHRVFSLNTFGKYSFHLLEVWLIICFSDHSDIHKEVERGDLGKDSKYSNISANTDEDSKQLHVRII